MRAENVVAGAPTGGMDQAASLRCIEGHALLLDCRDGSDRAGAARPRRAPGWPCWSSTPGPRTSWSTGSTASAGTPARRRPGRWAWRACARSTPGELDAALGRLPDDVVAPSGAARRDRDRAGPRGGGPVAAQRHCRVWGRSSTRRTPRCATTTRSPAASSTWPCESAPGRRCPRGPDDRRRLRRLGRRPGGRDASWPRIGAAVLARLRRTQILTEPALLPAPASPGAARDL